MFNTDASHSETTEKPVDTALLVDVQSRLRQAIANADGTPQSAEKIGLVGAGAGLIAVEFDFDKQIRRPTAAGDVYPGMKDPKVGVPNPAESLPALAIEDNKIAPSVERFEKLHNMPKDQHLTIGLIEAAVVDEKLPVSDREKFKALLPNFMYYEKLHLNPLIEPYVDLESARYIDTVNNKYVRFEKSVEAHAPDALKSVKFVTDKFSDIDHFHKGYLNANDYENALLNPKLDADDRKNLIYALDHKYFGSVDDIQTHFFGDVVDRGLMPWNKGWYYASTLASPCLAYRSDLQSIRNADDDARMQLLRYRAAVQ